MWELYSNTKWYTKVRHTSVVMTQAIQLSERTLWTTKVKDQKALKDQKSQEGHSSPIHQPESNMVTIPVAESYVPSYVIVQQHHQETSHYCMPLQWEIKVDGKQAIQHDRWACTRSIDCQSKLAMYAERSETDSNRPISVQKY